MSHEPRSRVLSTRVPEHIGAQVDALLTVGTRHRTESTLVFELIALGLQHFEAVEAQRMAPEARRARLAAAEQATTERRAASRGRPPEWEPELRRLHADGLSNAALAEAMGTTPENIRQRLRRLGLSANR